MTNFALNKITGIIVTVLILLVAVGYTTNSFSQTPSGNTTTGNTTGICDPDERFDENLQECVSIIPSNGNNDTIICDPGEVLDVFSNICHEPCELGQIFNPSTRTCITNTPDTSNDTQLLDDKLTSRPNVTINTNLDIVIKSSGNIIVLPMETGPGPIEPPETGPIEPPVTGPGPETEPQ